MGRSQLIRTRASALALTAFAAACVMHASAQEPAAAAKGKSALAGAGNMLSGSALIAAIYQKVDTTRVAAMGMSCGELMSYEASADPHIVAVGIWNSGLYDPKDQKIIDGIRSSVIIITGGESDIAHDNGKSDFEVVPPRVPIFYGVYPSVGHGGTYNQYNGGLAQLPWRGSSGNYRATTAPKARATVSG